MLEVLAALPIAFAWIGHAYILTSLLNILYGCALPKSLLKPWRLFTAVCILAFPALLLSGVNPAWFDFVSGSGVFLNGVWGYCVLAYAGICVCSGVAYPFVNLARYLRKMPACVVAEETRTLDLWPEYGEKLIGDGKFPWLTRVPGNCVFKLDVTELTLALPNLPPEWDGLTLLVVGDTHFHGTPSRVYFDRMINELAAGPMPDLVCLVGDYIDTKTHHEWIMPLLGRLQAKEAKLAILGNHDEYYHPERVRAELTAAGYTLLSNDWKEMTIRGVKCVAVGHEGPWFAPPPDLSGAPTGPFRLCLSHTPDNFYWAKANGIGLMFCGHVHGGGIRVPFIGSIFVPSLYCRRFDYGVFEEEGTVMAVSRGVSGKEPIRIRCNPQVFRVTLKAAGRR